MLQMLSPLPRSNLKPLPVPTIHIHRAHSSHTRENGKSQLGMTSHAENTACTRAKAQETSTQDTTRKSSEQTKSSHQEQKKQNAIKKDIKQVTPRKNAKCNPKHTQHTTKQKKTTIRASKKNSITHKQSHKLEITKYASFHNLAMAQC